eukprot:25369_1
MCYYERNSQFDERHWYRYAPDSILFGLLHTTNCAALSFKCVCDSQWDFRILLFLHSCVLVCYHSNSFYREYSQHARSTIFDFLPNIYAVFMFCDDNRTVDKTYNVY